MTCTRETGLVADWKKSSLIVLETVDDLCDVMEWLREDNLFRQADRLRTLISRLAKSVPPYPVFGAWNSPKLYRNMARTWPEQLTVPESNQLRAELASIRAELASIKHATAK